jgi:hypothetical protein
LRHASTKPPVCCTHAPLKVASSSSTSPEGARAPRSSVGPHIGRLGRVSRPVVAAGWKRACERSAGGCHSRALLGHLQEAAAEGGVERRCGRGGRRRRGGGQLWERAPGGCAVAGEVKRLRGFGCTLPRNNRERERERESGCEQSRTQTSTISKYTTSCCSFKCAAMQLSNPPPP